MKKGDRVMVITENARHCNMKGIISEIKGSEALIKFDDPKIKCRVMYYTWNLHLIEPVKKEEKRKEIYVLIGNHDETVSKIITDLNKAIQELDKLAKDYPNDIFYIFKCIGEAKAHTITTVNRFLY